MSFPKRVVTKKLLRTTGTTRQRGYTGFSSSARMQWLALLALLAPPASPDSATLNRIFKSTLPIILTKMIGDVRTFLVYWLEMFPFGGKWLVFTYHILPKPPNSETAVTQVSKDASLGGKGNWLKNKVLHRFYSHFMTSFSQCERNVVIRERKHCWLDQLSNLVKRISTGIKLAFLFFRLRSGQTFTCDSVHHWPETMFKFTVSKNTNLWGDRDDILTMNWLKVL